MSARAFRSWQVFVAALATLDALIVPTQLSLGPPTADFSLFDLFVTLVFLADVGLRMRHGERSRIWMVLDVIAAIPFGLVMANSGFRLLRLVKSARTVELMAGMWSANLQKPTLLRLVFFQFWLVMLTHWFACGWLALRGVNEHEPAITNYVRSLYFVVTTLTTVGFGDITAATNVERMYVMLMMFVGVGLFGYVIGNVASILMRVDPARAHHEERLERLEAFVRYKSLPPELQKKLIAYYSYIWEQRLGYDESAIVDALPSSLKMEVMLHLKREIIQKVPLFKDASEDFVREIVQQLVPVVYMPGDWVFKAGAAGKSMFFVSRGELDVIAPDGVTILSHLRDGDYFGEIALALQQERTASVRAKTFCDLYRLDQEAFASVVKNHPEVAATIERLAIERKARG
jgi:voltage-gated potassium channel